MSNPNSTLTQLEQKSDSGRLHTLYVVNDMLRQVEADGLDIHVILPRVLHVAVQQLNARSGSIIITDQVLQIEHAWLIGEDDNEINYVPLLDDVISDGLAGWVIRNQQPTLVDNTLTDTRWIRRADRPPATHPWSAISTPLIAGSEPIGVITIARPGISQFDQEDVNLLSTIANQAAVTIENARLYGDSRRRAEQLGTLVRASAAVSASLKIEQVVQVLAEQMVRLMQVEICLLANPDASTKSITLWAAHLPAAWKSKTTFSHLNELADFPLARESLRHARPYQLRPDEAKSSHPVYQKMVQMGIKSLFVVPLVAQDRIIALAQLMDTKVRNFSQQEIDLAQTLGNQAATAIENARLYQETERQLRASTILNAASKVINSSLESNEIMHSLLVQMNELLNVEALSIALVDKERNELVYEVAEGIGSDKIIGLRLPSNRGVSGWVMEHNQPALVPDTSRDPRFQRDGDERTGYVTRAIICAPLHQKGEVLGTIQAINPRDGTFADSDLQLLVNLANLTSSAIANAQHFARTQAAEARYVGLFEDSIDPIILTNKMGKIVEANRRACEFFGYQMHELLRLHVRALHPVESGLLGEKQFEPIKSDRVKVFASQAVTKDRKLIPVQVYAKRILTGNNELLQWIHHDISKQVELEQMRDDLMAMLFHDLQNPLGNIISSLELLGEEIPANSPASVRSILGIAIGSSRRLQSLVRSLLDISRLEAGHSITNLTLVNIRKLVSDAEEMVRPYLERRNIKIVHRFDRRLPNVYVDEDMIRRVILNLLDNAIKFSPGDETITIEVTEPLIDDKLILAVSDRGSGVPKQDRESIFEKFRRLQGIDSPKGLGLGLAFCRLAVEAHSGRIWVDDAPGGGARFSFTLPTKRPS